MINEIRRSVKERAPLIHCITNPISITRCADVILAAGARPMMAEHPKEAAIITRTAGAVMLNLGNFTDVRGESMMISAKTAKENGIPFVAVASTDQAGDANCDNVVDVSDAVLLARFCAEDSTAVITAQGKQNANLNYDSNITGDDVIAILRKIAKLD